MNLLEDDWARLLQRVSESLELDHFHPSGEDGRIVVKCWISTDKRAQKSKSIYLISQSSFQTNCLKKQAQTWFLMLYPGKQTKQEKRYP